MTDLRIRLEGGVPMEAGEALANGRSASVPTTGRLTPASRWLCVSRQLAIWDRRELVEQASWAPEWRRGLVRQAV